MHKASSEASLILTLILALAQAACTPKPDTDEAGPAPVDTSGTSPSIDTAARSPTIETGSSADTSVATPPITPSQSTTPLDTPPPAAKPPGGGETRSQQGQVSQAEYEGWRQYSVNCARCHGQDVLPNPVAANLLVSAAPGGPTDTPEKFIPVVSEGRPHRGMPAFKGTMSPEQIQAVYAYVKARADKRIPPGRPAEPKG
jgi:mono/diheme cytochrome c family protein